jgi:hypothetical protein
VASVQLRGPGGKLETLTGTELHPIWSVDRADWIPLSQLQPGERLLCDDASTSWDGESGRGQAHAIVLGVTLSTVCEPVYNLEIHGEHVYQVGELGVLVHNGNPADCPLESVNAPLVPGPNPNGLRQRTVTSPTPGEGGVYLKPQGGRTKIGSTGDFEGRYGANAKPGIEVEIPQTRNGPPAGVDDSAYPWSARAQRRFDEEYIDRITPPDARFRAPNARSPVDPDKWDKYRHIFGYGDLPSNFGF